MKDKFAVFILSHGRADNIITYQSLNFSGYTGKIYFLLDDEDKQRQRYYKNFGKENVFVFNKDEYANKIDTFDNFGEKRAIVYARHAVFDVARTLGLEYFLMLDDDFDAFSYKYIREDIFREDRIKNLDEIFDAMIEFLDSSRAKTVAFCQHGDLIGGKNSPKYHQGVLRKAMNAFFCRTDSPINFRGTMNEDVNTYTFYGSIGELYLSVTDISIHQIATQSLRGGMSAVYKEDGTYTKSMYSVMNMPSCVSLKTMGLVQKRIHHQVHWNKCMPKILNEKWKK